MVYLVVKVTSRMCLGIFEEGIVLVQIEHDLDLPAFVKPEQAEEYAVSLIRVFR